MHTCMHIYIRHGTCRLICIVEGERRVGGWRGESVLERRTTLFVGNVVLPSFQSSIAHREITHSILAELS